MRRSMPALSALAFAASLSWAPAQATSYDFQLNYLSGNQAAAADGSQSPEGTVIDPGDSFVYALQAQAGMAWLVNATDNYFGFAALSASESAVRIGDVTVTLSLAGMPVYSWSGSDEPTNYVHVGGNTFSLSQGLMFDKLQISYALTSAEGCDYDQVTNICTPTGPADTTLGGPLPIFGAPDFHYSDGFSYVTAVPEPAPAALLLLGLLPLAVLRRRARAD